MKIVFVCGSLEPGCDGVGDYTRRLSAEMTRCGHEASIIALNDMFINHIVEVTQVDGYTGIKVLRLPKHLTWKQRTVECSEFITSLDPEWVSLQYVPYAFHPKGMPFKLGKYLNQIGQGRKWSVMFHETWVGVKKHSPITHKFYATFQKKIVRCLVSVLKPENIFTSNRIYQLELLRNGVHANILPLFSNISKTKLDFDFVSKIYQKLDTDQTGVQNFFLLGVFGTITKELNLEGIIHKQLETLDKVYRKLVVVSFGRTQSLTEYERLESLFQDQVAFISLGELSEDHISSVFQILNLGIPSTPKEYISKSGIYAAMRLHNVNIMLSSSMMIPQYKDEIDRFNKYLEHREAYKWDVKYVAAKFYEYFSMYTNI